MPARRFVRPLAIAATAALALCAGTAQATQGLTGAYYAGAYGSNPATLGGTPTASFIANTVCFPSCSGSIDDSGKLSSFLNVAGGNASSLSNDLTGLNNHALVLTGFLNIAATGTYTFKLNSDDGSLLYIDGNLVVNDANDHAPTDATTSGYALTSGSHALRIYQEERGGGTGLSAYINGTALGGNLISTTAAVPEPASWAMMVAGFGMLGAALRRRRPARVRFA